jgi:hypothetical protein
MLASDLIDAARPSRVSVSLNRIGTPGHAAGIGDRVTFTGLNTERLCLGPRSVRGRNQALNITRSPHRSGAVISRPSRSSATAMPNSPRSRTLRASWGAETFLHSDEPIHIRGGDALSNCPILSADVPDTWDCRLGLAWSHLSRRNSNVVRLDVVAKLSFNNTNNVIGRSNDA